MDLLQCTTALSDGHFRFFLAGERLAAFFDLFADFLTDFLAVFFFFAAFAIVLAAFLTGRAMRLATACLFSPRPSQPVSVKVPAAREAYLDPHRQAVPTVYVPAYLIRPSPRTFRSPPRNRTPRT